MEQTEGASPPPPPPLPPPPPPLPAQHHADCGEKSDDTPETEKEELTKDGEESLRKNQGGQTSVSEKQMTADEKCSEEGVQDELPRQEASGLPHRTFSFPNLRSSNLIRGDGLCVSSLKKREVGSRRRKKSRGQVTHNIPPSPGPSTSNWYDVPSIHELAACIGCPPSPYIPSHSSSFDSTELILRNSKKTYPTAADPTPGHILDDARGTELPATDPLIFQSLQSNRDSDSAACYDREKGVQLSGSTVGGHDNPQKKEVTSWPYRISSDLSSPVLGSSIMYRGDGLPSPSQIYPNHTVVQGSRTAEKSTGQVPLNFLPYLIPLDVSPFPPPTSNWNNFLSQCVSSPSPSIHPSTGHLPTITISSTAADPSPGHSQDYTRGAASPWKPVLLPHACLLSASSSTQIHSVPEKPGGSAREEMSPLVTENLSVMPLDLSMKRIPKVTDDTDSSDSDWDTSEHSKLKSAVKHKRKSKIHSSRRKKKHKKSSPCGASPVVSSDYTLAQPSPGPLRETVIKIHSTAAGATPGHSQDDTRETELPATAGPSTPQHSPASDDSDFCFFQINSPEEDDSWSYSHDDYTAESRENRYEIMSVKSENASGAESDAQLEMETSLTGVSSFTNNWTAVSACPSPLQLPDFQVQSESSLCSPDLEFDNLFSSFFSTVHTAESGEVINVKLQPSECEAAGDSDSLVKMEAPVTAVISSVTNTQPTRPHLQLSSDPGWSQRGSSCLPRSHSVPSLSQRSCAENQTFRPSQSLPDMLLKSSFEEFTPDITVDEDDESYRFLCSCPGLYQCSVTGLVFHMEGEGDVVYRIVSWDRRLLAQHHKKPAGPLFDIKCQQKSVCRLHLPHCEIPSTAGCQFLSVAHLNDEGIEFIAPHKVTDTHVIINISGFSAFGNVKDEDSPPEPVRALVLLFYRPPNDADLTSFLNVLMLPRNVVLRDVRRTRKKLVGDELYIETSSHCKLLPGQEYTLSTCPEDDSVLVQPKEAEFDEESYDNYIPSFQVTLKTVILNMKVLLRDTSSSHIVWEREVCLPSAGVKRLCVQGRSDRILKDIRSSFIEGISGPVLKSLLDKLFEKKVLIDSERESADEMQNRGDKARLVIDTVRRKGEAASSEMIEFLCELDPFLCKHLGLTAT
ncbi:uncharacterized protein LOC119009054 isoform X2 [Acanthopagrus latus]|uniref:uncharacterized protein LOC119009054 isoform X2 n=1 Tax=Acanthopagrus latus TaxID=8177 RepID=UPI00187C7552|nr:uncharacterized protein LOC119009054 isoform X2 [Acanthopagrus latus]